MTKDGSAPQCCSATVSIEVVVVLPWVPATATAAAAGHQRRQRLCAAQHPQPAARAPRPARGCPSGWRSTRRRSSASPSVAASCPTWTRAPSARSAASRRESLASLPDTRTPRASRIRAMPDMPAPADADEVDRAEACQHRAAVRLDCHGRPSFGVSGVPPAACRTRDTSARGGIGRAGVRAAADAAASRSGAVR